MKGVENGAGYIVILESFFFPQLPLNARKLKKAHTGTSGMVTFSVRDAIVYL